MFNIIDFLILLITVYLVWQGWQTGFVGGVLNIIATIVSLVLATVFYPGSARFIDHSLNWGENVSQVAAFFAILIILEVALSLALSHFYRLLTPFYKKVRGFLIVDRVLGVIPSVLVGLFLVTLFLLLPLVLPFKAGLRAEIENSWWGSNVLPIVLKYQPITETYLNKLPYKNLAYLITPEPGSKETVQLAIPKKIEFTIDQESEKEMFDLVNYERRKRGISELVFNKALRDVGRAHCLDMFKRSYFSHYTPEGKSPFDRMNAAGIKYTVAGENLAYAPTVKIAHEGLMNSKGHRENMLRSSFGKLGVGVVDGGIAGKMFCQEFTN